MARLLFVDDEPEMTRALRRLFADEHECFTAGNTAEALAVLERESGRINLVCSDFRMPGAFGDVLLSRIAERWPSIKLMLLSGISPHGDGGHHAFSRCPRGTVCLEKPFDLMALLGAVDDLLAGRPSSHGTTV